MLEKELNVKTRKVFIVTGELSGDRTAAWFVKRSKSVDRDVYFEGVGGDALNTCGVELYERFEKLNVVGIIEIIKHLPFILGFMRRLLKYIKLNGFDEVVLVDFPGFNLRMAKKLKSQIPGIKITYLAPPQLWCWGAWRVKKIKKYCDRVVVLYPFEVKWYTERGVNAEWIGNSVYDALSPYFNGSEEKENLIALIPGSRAAEIKRFMPILADVANLFLKNYPNVKFVIPAAESLPADFLRSEIESAGLNIEKVKILQSDNEKIISLKKCCLAITKPGTVTLELALLCVPSVVYFRISWLTYILGRPLVKVRFMALANLLLNKEVFKECIQSECTADIIFTRADMVYKKFIKNNKEYRADIFSLEFIRALFGSVRVLDQIHVRLFWGKK